MLSWHTPLEPCLSDFNNSARTTFYMQIFLSLWRILLVSLHANAIQGLRSPHFLVFWLPLWLQHVVFAILQLRQVLWFWSYLWACQLRYWTEMIQARIRMVSRDCLFWQGHWRSCHGELSLDLPAFCLQSCMRCSWDLALQSALHALKNSRTPKFLVRRIIRVPWPTIQLDPGIKERRANFGVSC